MDESIHSFIGRVSCDSLAAHELQRRLGSRADRQRGVGRGSECRDEGCRAIPVPTLCVCNTGRLAAGVVFDLTLRKNESRKVIKNQLH